MRLLAVTLVCLLCVSAAAHAAVAHVHSDNGACGASGTGNMTTSGACVTGSSHSFTYTANAANNAVIVTVACSDSTTTPSAVSVSGSGWTFTQISTLKGNLSGSGWVAMFKAYALNTTAATFTESWTTGAGDCSGFMNDLIDEYSGVDQTNFADGVSACGASTTLDCNAGITITPGVNDEAIQFTCNDNATGVNAPFTIGGDDGVGDMAEWQVLTGGAGTPVSPDFVGSGAPDTFCRMGIKPAASASAAPLRMLLGVGTGTILSLMLFVGRNIFAQ